MLMLMLMLAGRVRNTRGGVYLSGLPSGKDARSLERGTNAILFTRFAAAASPWQQRRQRRLWTPDGGSSDREGDETYFLGKTHYLLCFFFFFYSFFIRSFAHLVGSIHDRFFVRSLVAAQSCLFVCLLSLRLSLRSIFSFCGFVSVNGGKRKEEVRGEGERERET